MITTGKKLIIALLMVLFSLVLMRFNSWFGVGVVVGLVLAILYTIDYATELRTIENANKLQHFLLVLLTVPQILFGIGIIAIGASIVLWVLYNNFVARQSEYTGGFLTFGMAPIFIVFGIGLLISALKKRDRKSNES